MVEYLDPEIANEGQSANDWNPGAWTTGASLEGEEYQPEFEPPHINDYAALKKHKQYAKYFRPYRYIPFPAVLYHKSLGEKIVNSEAEVKALGPEWSRTPFTLKVDMTGKSLPAKSDTQRLTEALVAGQAAIANKPGIDAGAVAAIVAATLAALQQNGPQPALQAQPDAAGDREALEQLAAEKGIKVDGRWSDDRLRKELGL